MARAASRPGDMAEQLFNSALSRHRSGDLAEAERLYRQVVAEAPNHAAALHNLGLLTQSRGRLEEASDWLQRAAASNPGDAACLNNLGNVRRELGQYAQALAAYQAAVKCDPEYVNAYFNLAAVHMKTGDARAAADCYSRILQLVPDEPEAASELGIAMMALGEPARAIASFQHALGLQPNDPVAHYNLATAYRQEQRVDAALAAYRQALAIDPHYAAAHNNVGLLLKAKGEHAQAARAFREALRANARHLPAHVNLASLLLDQNEPALAEAQCREALALEPEHAGLLQNLGAALLEQQRWQEAAESYQRVLRQAGDDLPAHVGLAAALSGLRQSDEAERVLRRGLQIDPEHARLRLLLGNALLDQERLDEASAQYRCVDSNTTDYASAQDGLARALRRQGHIRAALAAYERALAARPDSAESHSNWVFTCNYLTDMAAEDVFDAHRSFALRFTSHLAPCAGELARAPSTVLHIGYVSADFYRHSVAYFIEPLINARDRERIRVTCYANVERADDMTARIRAAADGWRDIRGMSDEAVAKLVREDGVHILVDLSGHTAGNRLLVFARRPAPVQVSYLGYANTTGLAQMDYRLSDALADPAGESEHLHTESLLRLATGFLCYSPASDTPPVSQTPALANGYITFGSFNNVAKVNEQVVAAWARILMQLPSSRLWLKSRQLDDPGAQRRLLELFARHQIEPARLELVGGLLARSSHLQTYARVDIALDPFPYNGTTTTCEALWMGVPVVSLTGSSHRGRVGASILHHSGLGELSTRDLDGYVGKALSLASDLQALSALRAGLRARMAASPLMDAAAAARDLENAYRQMWDEHLQAATRDARPDENPGAALRLHIGGSERREGWKILNILPGPEVDYVGSCTDLGAFADESVDEVYASHVLEHLGYAEELPAALREIHRILKAGARLRISVPDLEVLLRLYLNPETDRSARWEIMRMLYGGQVDQFDYHKLGFSWDSLAWYLRQIGFTNIQRVQEFGIFEDTSSLRMGGQLVSLSVEARK